MRAGVTFTIEPMLCLGSREAYVIWEDDWTVVTQDRKQLGAVRAPAACRHRLRRGDSDAARPLEWPP